MPAQQIQESDLRMQLRAADVNTLILKGGGVKAFAFAGAIRVLQEHGFTFRNYVGTSAGAVAAVLLGAGYTPDELERLLTTTQFRRFRDASPLRAFWNLVVKGGLYPGRHLMTWVEEALRTKFDQHTHPQITMESFASVGSRVIAFASHPLVGTLTFDTSGDRKDRPVSDAVRLSSSIPGFFIPGEEGLHRIYDGGLLHNFPVEVYQRIAQQRPEDADFVAIYIGRPPGHERRWWFLEVLSIMLARDDTLLLRDYKERSLFIDTSPVGTTEFELSMDETALLVARGEAAGVKFLLESVDLSEQKKESIEKQHTDVMGKLGGLEAAARRSRRRRLHKRIARYAAAAALALVVAGFAYAWLDYFEPQFRYADSAPLLNSYVSTSGSLDASQYLTTGLPEASITDLKETLRAFPDEYENDSFRFDSMMQFIVERRPGTGGEPRPSYKLVVLEGTPTAGNSGRIRGVSVQQGGPPSSWVGVFTRQADGSWAKDGRCEDDWRRTTPEGTSEQFLDSSNCLGEGTALRVVFFTQYHIDMAVTPWVLHAHRLVEEQGGEGLYLFLGGESIVFPEEAYFGNTVLRHLRLPNDSYFIRSSPEERAWRRITGMLGFLKDAGLQGFEEEARPGFELLVDMVEQARVDYEERGLRDKHFVLVLDSRNLRKLGSESLSIRDTNAVVFAEDTQP